jgi:hypothetical protein
MRVVCSSAASASTTTRPVGGDSLTIGCLNEGTWHPSFHSLDSSPLVSDLKGSSITVSSDYALCFQSESIAGPAYLMLVEKNRE